MEKNESNKQERSEFEKTVVEITLDAHRKIVALNLNLKDKKVKIDMEALRKIDEVEKEAKAENQLIIVKWRDKMNKLIEDECEHKMEGNW